MAIYLIRHGETAGNAARVLQAPETPLNDHGRDQAARLARRLSDAGIVRILASDLERAAMTARALQESTGAELSYDTVLHERNFGDLRGRAYADLGFDPFSENYTPPAGEGWTAFHQRVDDAWEGVARAALETDGNLAVVTHGLVCSSLVGRILTLTAGMSAIARFGNTALTVMDSAPPWTVRLLNCTAHLGAATARSGGEA